VSFGNGFAVRSTDHFGPKVPMNHTPQRPVTSESTVSPRLPFLSPAHPCNLVNNPVQRSFSASDSEILYRSVQSSSDMYSLLLHLRPMAAASVVPRQYLSFGNYFSTGPTASGTYIVEVTTTLVLPALNSPHNGNLGLWPGTGMDDGDLVQGLAISTVGVGRVTTYNDHASCHVRFNCA
jgi:hypothetical protein